MIYFHSFTVEEGKKPLILDIVQDIRSLNNMAIHAKKSGMIILGGGLIKHHICNANLMRNGADFSVFINTGQDFDGSDSGKINYLNKNIFQKYFPKKNKKIGAKPDEAVSWVNLKLFLPKLFTIILYFF